MNSGGKAKWCIFPNAWSICPRLGGRWATVFPEPTDRMQAGIGDRYALWSWCRQAQGSSSRQPTQIQIIN
jgi:hypothetical protein